MKVMENGLIFPRTGSLQERVTPATTLKYGAGRVAKADGIQTARTPEAERRNFYNRTQGVSSGDGSVQSNREFDDSG